MMPSNVKRISSQELFIKQLCNPTDKITYYALVWKILRSQIGLSSTFQRLLFGLCVADILWPFSFILSTLMIPKEVDYLYLNSRGTVTTCNAQGFLQIVGFSGSLYNCSICVHYLAIVTYNKSDEFIRKKIEP